MTKKNRKMYFKGRKNLCADILQPKKYMDTMNKSFYQMNIFVQKH